MGFSKAYIASQPATERRHARNQPAKTYPARPGVLYTSVDIEGNISDVYVPDPVREGEVYFYTDITGNHREASMYVGVDVTPAYGSPIDGGNFTSGASSATDNDTFDAGNFTGGTSAILVSATVDGGLYPVKDLAWKPVAPVSVINGYTGKRVDPLYRG